MIYAGRGYGQGNLTSSDDVQFTLNVTIVKGENRTDDHVKGDSVTEKIRQTFRPLLSLWFRAESNRRFDRVRFLLVCNETHGAIHMYSPPTTRALSTSVRNGNDQLLIQPFSRRQCMARTVQLVITKLYEPIRTLFRDTCGIYGSLDDPDSPIGTRSRKPSTDSYLSSVYVVFMICLAVSFLVCVWAMANELKKRTPKDDIKGRSGRRKRRTTPRTHEIAVIPQHSSIPPTSDFNTLDSTVSLLR